MKFKKILSIFLFLVIIPLTVYSNPPIYIAFQWHMHQPIYWPYETVIQTTDANRYSFSPLQVHLDRTGPYTTWPVDAVQAGYDLPNFGAQVSFTGSLIENLNNIEKSGRGFANWKSRWIEAMNWKTTLKNPRLSFVEFGYHHPMMGLIDYTDLKMQIELQRFKLKETFPNMVQSKGMFPPETGFSPRMIPALYDAGIQWVIIDSIHLERAHKDYPYTPSSNLYPPNASDQLNTAPVTWIQLTDLWAPSKVGVPWAYQPHYIAYTDPNTGIQKKIIGIMAARYEGNEDARGGFGALQYEKVMSQYEKYNTDPYHPMLVVLHHDGDNYGGGSESYYHSNFNNFVAWLKANPTRFVCTTIQDYLDMYPPDKNDVVHVEDGSWSGADNGDPEFLKWNGNPDSTGYSPDRHSWAVITAIKNRVLTAEAITSYSSLKDVAYGTGNDTSKAWHFFLNGEASDYWYWDNAENGIWDSHPSRAANLAAQYADKVIGNGVFDTTPPTIYLPQREPYNPGGIEWGKDPMPSDFTVWTYVYDVSGLKSVTLKYRVDSTSKRDAENEVYAGRAWESIAMVGKEIPSKTNPVPIYKALEYSAQIKGLSNVLVDYYVEAKDEKGNIGKSPIRHVYVGQNNPGQNNDLWIPQNPTKSDVITIFSPKPGWLHWGVNNWKLPNEVYWPAGTFPYGDGAAVETPLVGPDSNGKYTVQIGPFNNEVQTVTEVNFVFRYLDGWSSPDQKIIISQIEDTNPKVYITSPKSGDEVTGEVEIIAKATDNEEITKVEFYVDDEKIDTVREEPYSTIWNTNRYQDGSEHTIYAKAYDNENNVTTSAKVVVTVKNERRVLCGRHEENNNVHLEYMVIFTFIPSFYLRIRRKNYNSN